jgi:hypothetical protein
MPHRHRQLALIVALGVLAGPPGAWAQLWPGNLKNQGLSDQDLEVMNRATANLYRGDGVKIGRTENWRNPATGNSGTAALVGTKPFHGMSCRQVHYQFDFAKTAQKRSYTLNWCLTPQNEWRIAD